MDELLTGKNPKADARLMSNVFRGNELVNHPVPVRSTADAEVAIWFGLNCVAWQIASPLSYGTSKDWHTAIADIQAKLAITDTASDVIGRTIRHERNAGRGEPRITP